MSIFLPRRLPTRDLLLDLAIGVGLTVYLLAATSLEGNIAQWEPGGVLLLLPWPTDDRLTSGLLTYLIPEVLLFSVVPVLAVTVSLPYGGGS